ncbi:TRAP-type mannitol/chloroaromatic compound transport system substrate-binding protein [Palleronia aestuarii]|uniref:TRAP-type mannitol/chloroaromatic compound transport system substrate-binding protein n=1 Tax=Palleronia aestuarii TaxID=568105 RepID=A0A2W7NDN7_9RHOB|nr:TRAP transporter substrate-binding protein [Palleronia aestuarii]PZX18515.1 TRAP-type mannitol/chloroaromatic compound transport system substrate-binding protein [Palleronia aestuarii]
MDRRTFLRNSALGGSAAAASGLAAPAYAQGNRTLTLVTTWGRGLAGVHDSAQYCADKITALTDGALTVDLKAAGELVGAFEVFDAVTAGQADMYHAADYYFTGQHPAYQFFTSLPFGMTSQELHNWYYHRGGQGLHDELGQIFGLKSFLAGNTGAQAGGWFQKEINGPEDFQGLRMRAPGQSGEVFAKLGASVQNIPGAEVYQALSSGALDAVDWIGPWADEAAGFQEITKFYYTASAGEPGPGISLATNRTVFEELSPAHQQVIEQVSAAANSWTLALFVANNAAALGRLQQAGVRTLTFPDPVWDALGAASQEVYQEYMGDPLYKKIFDSYQTSMASSAQWIEMSEQAYSRQRDRILQM